MKEKSPTPARTRWLKRGVGFLVVYALVGFILAPAVIKSQLLQRLPALTHRQASVGSVRVNPFVLSLAVRELSLTETNGDRFAGFGELRVNLQLSSALHRAWVFKEVTLRKPFFRAIKEPSGEMNFDDIVIEMPRLPAASIQALNVETGQVLFVDRSLADPFQTTFLPVNLRLTNFTTLPDQDRPYAFSASTDAGAEITWQGDVSVNPLRSRGQFTLTGLPLAKYQPYLQNSLAAELASGTLDVRANYRVGTISNLLDVEIKELNVALSNFQLRSAADPETILRLPVLFVTNAGANLLSRSIHIGGISLNGGSLLARRNQDQTINWLDLLKTPPRVTPTNPPVASTITARPARSWTLRLDELAVENFTLSAEDRVPARPARFDLDQLRLLARGLSNQSNAPVTAELSFRPNGAGQVSLLAQGTLLPAAAQAHVSFTNLDVRPGQPYVSEFLNLVVNNGVLSGEHDLQFNALGQPLLSVKGGVTIRNFSATDTVSFADTIKWDEHRLQGVEFSWQPNRLHVGSIHFDGLQSSVVLTTNGQFNVMSWLKQPATNTAAAASPSPAAGGDFPITIGLVSFERSRFLAEDQSINPHFATAIEDFAGNIKGISLQGTNIADVDLRGRLNPGSQFALTGRVRPVPTNLFLALKVDSQNTDLTPLTPYFEKFAGYPLLKGRLLLDIAFELDGHRLQSSNVVKLEQLTLGARNQSPDATKLPVKLGIALLKDRNGVIALDLPVSGSLDDPQFRIGKIVWQVVQNLLVKAATAPFALLGSLFGGGPEIQFVEFAPGSPVIPTDQVAKLDTLIKALHERPELALEMSGSFAEADDRPALSRFLLERRLKSLRAQELTAQGVTPPSLDELQLDPTDAERLLRKMHEETFGIQMLATNAENALAAGALPDTVSVATNNPPRQAPAATPLPRSSAIAGKGVLNLMEIAASRRAERVAEQTSGSSAAPSADKAPVAETPGQPALTREMLAQQLADRFPATEEDLRTLAQARARVVHEFLLRSQQIEAGRLLVTTAPLGEAEETPKARVTFSLN